MELYIRTKGKTEGTVIAERRTPAGMLGVLYIPQDDDKYRYVKIAEVKGIRIELDSVSPEAGRDEWILKLFRDILNQFMGRNHE